MKSSWKNVECSQCGVLLNENERQRMRYPECSLTIPRLKFGEIGTLVVTSTRLVFLIFQKSTALSYDLTNTKKVEPSQHPQYPGYGFLLVTTEADEIFTFQGALQLITSISALMQPQVPTAPVQRVIAPQSKTDLTNQIHGVAAIKQHVEDGIKKNDQTLSASLQDINTLKDCAKDLIAIASELSKMTDSESTSEMSQICLAIGLENPVKKEKGQGSKYAIQLANEFSKYMSSLLPRVKDGYMSVAESYAAYNRARGNDFVSPPDLQEALDYIESKDEFPIKVETIGDARIIVPKNVSFDSVVESFLTKLGPNDYATPMMMAKKTNLPTTIAKNYLIRAEKQGVLARDDSLAGIRFYINRFDTFELIDF